MPQTVTDNARRTDPPRDDGREADGESFPRLRGTKQHRIDYRHVITSHVRKPGAFANYRFREELCPTLALVALATREAVAAWSTPVPYRSARDSVHEQLHQRLRLELGLLVRDQQRLDLGVADLEAICDPSGPRRQLGRRPPLRTFNERRGQTPPC